MSTRKDGWIGVDLDGTPAHYDGWQGSKHIGAPIPKMVERVKRWLAEGKRVKIFTARVSCKGDERDAAMLVIFDWCVKHIGQGLAITNEKDYGMYELWDDRAVQVIPNLGERVGREPVIEIFFPGSAHDSIVWLADHGIVGIGNGHLTLYRFWKDTSFWFHLSYCFEP